MRLTVRTNLAMRVLMFCAVNPGRMVKKSEIAANCNASENHLGVVISRLGQTGFLATTRGRNGGIRLSRPASAIAVGDVFRTFEAGVPFAECFSAAENTCPIRDCCKLRGALGTALAAFYAELDQVTLGDLTCGNTGLHRLLELEAV